MTLESLLHAFCIACFLTGLLAFGIYVIVGIWRDQ